MQKKLLTKFSTYLWLKKKKKLGVLFLPSSDVYVRSFLYLLYTLIKLYYTKTLSDQASSLAPDWILLLQRPRIPASLRGSATTFHLGGSSGNLQDKMGANNSSLTPLNCILKNWDRFDPQGLKKTHLSMWYCMATVPTGGQRTVASWRVS